MRILLVDDNEASLRGLTTVLQDLGHEPEPAPTCEEALARFMDDPFPLVITDIRMPGMNGLEFLGRLKATESGQDADVVLITGHGDMETAVEALRKGAYDYLNKPINARELAVVVDRSAERQALLRENRDWRFRFRDRLMEATQDLWQDLDKARSRLREVAGIGQVVAESPVMRRLLEETALYHADPSVPVIIEGETGSGKEIVARLIHYGEGNSDAPFVAINCAAIPRDLFESELFGHEPGAYSGSAPKGAPGKLELAGSGTLFLDEIAEMPLSLQPKLLRVLEDRSFYRLGGVKKRRFEARIVGAANRDLASLVESGAFRRDLFHRLQVGHLVVPPLRQRPEDIEPLALHILLREAERKKKRFAHIHPDALRLLKAHPWPGNVREMENAIERVVLTADSDVLQPEHLWFLTSAESTAERTAPAFSGHPPLDPRSLVLPEGSLDLEELTMEVIRKAVDKFGGNKTKAADYLGLSRYALHRRLNRP